MRFPTFLLERNQTLYENDVEINLTESGVHPCTIADLLSPEEIAGLGSLALGYGYTEGRPGLRQAVADWYPDARPENVLIAHGSSEANLVALTAFVERGDEIVFITPNFMQLDGLARGLGISVRQVPLSADAGWQPDLGRIDAAIGPQTRLITVCDPNNPTGTMLTDRSRRDLAALAEGRGVWLLVDEIYRGSEIDGGPASTAWNVSPRVIVSGGLSKSFACPGLRLGWLIAPTEVIDACHRYQDYTTIGTGTLAQFLAERAMQPATRDRLLQRGRQILAAGRETVRDWLTRRNGWSWVEPRAGGMAFLAYDFTMPSEELSVRLRTEESVFVAAGAWFGIEGHIRIGIGVAPEHLKEGLVRIDRFLDRHRPARGYARE
jgi:aspartate/methionine/tyrosine aminotransferase